MSFPDTIAKKIPNNSFLKNWIASKVVESNRIIRNQCKLEEIGEYIKLIIFM